MSKLSKKAAAVLNGEGLQVINADVWHDIQNPMKLRCELFWFDKRNNKVSVEVPLYAVNQAYAKVGHGCCINIICPSGIFIPSAIDIDVDDTIGLDLPYEPLIQGDELNADASCETNVIVTRRELVEVEVNILKAIEEVQQ